MAMISNKITDDDIKEFCSRYKISPKYTKGVPTNKFAATLIVLALFEKKGYATFEEINELCLNSWGFQLKGRKNGKSLAGASTAKRVKWYLVGEEKTDHKPYCEHLTDFFIIEHDRILPSEGFGLPDGPSPDLIDDIDFHRQDYKTLEKTERESIIKSRIGQGIFRDRLIELWGGCSVTGLKNISLLRASHIKPWRDCSNQERLDPMNGLLLHPTFDHLFDSGFITFENNGQIKISEKLSKEDSEILHLSQRNKLKKIPVGLENYMSFHRQHVFKHG